MFARFIHCLVGLIAALCAADYWAATIAITFMFWRYEVNETVALERTEGRYDPGYEEMREFLIGACLGAVAMLLTDVVL